jgi:hypothetical protein
MDTHCPRPPILSIWGFEGRIIIIIIIIIRGESLSPESFWVF